MKTKEFTIQINTEVLKKINGNQYLLWAMIVQLHKRNKCYASNDYFAQILSVSARTIQKYLDNIEAQGLLSRKFDNSNKNNTKRILIPTGYEQTVDEMRKELQGGGEENFVAVMKKTSHNEITNPQKNEIENTALSRFKEITQSYNVDVNNIFQKFKTKFLSNINDDIIKNIDSLVSNYWNKWLKNDGTITKKVQAKQKNALHQLLEQNKVKAIEFDTETFKERFEIYSDNYTAFYTDNGMTDIYAIERLMSRYSYRFVS